MGASDVRWIRHIYGVFGNLGLYFCEYNGTCARDEGVTLSGVPSRYSILISFASSKTCAVLHCSVRISHSSIRGLCDDSTQYFDSQIIPSKRK